MKENNEKVGILTFHIAHNYGAVLQAYALPTVVKSMGYDCEIIHYCFPYIYKWGHIDRLGELCNSYGNLGGFLRYTKRFLKGVYSPLLKQNKFENFIYKTIPLSKKAYMSCDELSQVDYDTILFGSDQIWNSQLTGGISKEFVGGFKSDKNTKKIAYAASCGRKSLLDEEKKAYYPLLKKFHALGIREKGFCNSLFEDGFNAQTVLDPTLLLSGKEWDSMAKSIKTDIKPIKEPYLLVYAFDEEPSFYSFVDRISEKYNLNVCVIASRTKPETEKYNVYTNCGPADFIHLISEADAVVTTSFHGTAFSIIFEKVLFCVPHPTLHERTDSLLTLVGLEERNCTVTTDLDKLSAIDWQNVKSKLSVECEKSLKFLKDNIG